MAVLEAIGRMICAEIQNLYLYKVRGEVYQKRGRRGGVT